MAIAIAADAIGRAIEQKPTPTLRTVACSIVLVISVITFGIVKTDLFTRKAEIQAILVRRTSPASASWTQQLLDASVKPSRFKEDRIVLASYLLVGASLITSFIIIVRVDHA